jgi:hypothetical protein
MAVDPEANVEEDWVDLAKLKEIVDAQETDRRWNNHERGLSTPSAPSTDQKAASASIPLRRSTWLNDRE